MILPTLSNNGNNFCFTVLLLLEEYQLNSNKKVLNNALAQIRIAKVFKKPVVIKIIFSPKFKLSTEIENLIPKNKKV